MSARSTKKTGLCRIGIHQYKSGTATYEFLRDADNRSFFREDLRCAKCGKVSSTVFTTPKV